MKEGKGGTLMLRGAAELIIQRFVVSNVSGGECFGGDPTCS